MEIYAGIPPLFDEVAREIHGPQEYGRPLVCYTNGLVPDPGSSVRRRVQRVHVEWWKGSRSTYFIGLFQHTELSKLYFNTRDVKRMRVWWQ